MIRAIFILVCFLELEATNAFISRVHNSPVMNGFNKKYSSNIKMSSTELTFAQKVEAAILGKYGSVKSKRVLQSFFRLKDGNMFQKDWGGHENNKQTANSYIEGLTPIHFHDVDKFYWAQELMKFSDEIRNEFQEVTGSKEALEKGNNIWVTAANDYAAATYGPDWNTLVMQDYNRWDEANSKLFPKTVSILKKLRVPSAEAFFARQKPNTGIKAHSDDCNFILTAHLAIDVPPGQSWISVGGEKRYWENDKMLIFDTSFLHETSNESDTQNRIVLLLRFWHPELEDYEVRALKDIFDIIEDPELADQMIKQGKKGKKNKKKNKMA